MKKKNNTKQNKNWPVYDDEVTKLPQKRRTSKRKRGLVYYLRRFLRAQVRNIKYLSRKLSINRGALYFALGIILLSSIFFFVFKKNAYSIFINDELICNIKYDKNITEESINDLTKIKLKTEIGSEVKLLEPIVLKKQHISKKEMVDMDTAVNMLYKKHTYEIEASVISVDNVEMTFLKNEQEAQSVLQSIKSNYETTDDAKSEFVENVTVSKKFVPQEKIEDTSTAINILSATSTITEAYTIQSGDNLGKIAIMFDMTQSELLSANPDITLETKLKIGQQLNVVSAKPIISVKTIENVVTVKVSEYIIEEKLNPNEGASYKKTLQQGENGEDEVTEQIIKINGVEQSREEINRTAIKPAVPNIVEIGAGE